MAIIPYVLKVYSVTVLHITVDNVILHFSLYARSLTFPHKTTSNKTLMTSYGSFLRKVSKPHPLRTGSDFREAFNYDCARLHKADSPDEQKLRKHVCRKEIN